MARAWLSVAILAQVIRAIHDTYSSTRRLSVAMCDVTACLSQGSAESLPNASVAGTLDPAMEEPIDINVRALDMTSFLERFIVTREVEL